MAACTNNGGSRARRAVTAALVGVLSVGSVPMAAIAEGVDGIQAMTSDATDQQLWDASTFEWNIDADAYGTYKVEPGDVFALESVTDVYDQTVSASDYAVYYFTSTGTAVRAADAIDGRDGGMPKGVANAATSYTAAVVDISEKQPKMVEDYSLNDLESNYSVHKQAFTVVASAAKTLSGAYAFNGTDEKDVSDTSFMYTGNQIVYSFADAEGNVLDSNDYDIAWLTSQPGKDAGTYTALLTGKGEYAGSTAQVSFTVNKIDLSTAVVTVDAATSMLFNNNALQSSAVPVYVNGEQVAPGVLDLVCISYTDSTGKTDSTLTANQLNGNLSVPGSYTLKVTGTTGTGMANDNVTGGVTTTTAYIVSQLATVKYDETDVVTYFTNRTFETSKGEGFDPSLLTATVNGDEVPLKATVTKDGVEVTSYDEPGEYVLSLEVPVPATCAYGYKKDVTFTVLTRDINANDVVVYASIDGKSLNGAARTLPYTGEAYVPSVVVKERSKVLTAGTDYTVSYRVEGEKDAIDSMVDPGDYEIVVSFPGSKVSDYVIKFTIDKANIVTVEPAADFFAIPEEGAATPSFVGKTSSGQEFALDADEISVRYYKANWNDTTKQYDQGTAVKAEDLTEEGTYFADVNVLSNAKNVKGGDDDVLITLSKTAVFADVNANAWYAQVVAKAYSNYYVNGIAGTNLYAPEAEITRADVACILFNMAGAQNAMVGDKEFQFSENTGYVTGFDDVDGHAYYAQAIAWAHASGVVNGYDGNFRPNDKITREEFASMLANFAKVKGDYVAAGSDAMSGIADASSVSSWAEANVAWAVENGIMGNAGSVWAQNNISRAEVAAMAVNYQPVNLIGKTR